MSGFYKTIFHMFPVLLRGCMKQSYCYLGSDEGQVLCLIILRLQLQALAPQQQGVLSSFYNPLTPFVSMPSSVTARELAQGYLCSHCPSNKLTELKKGLFLCQMNLSVKLGQTLCETHFTLFKYIIFKTSMFIIYSFLVFCCYLTVLNYI